MNSKVQEMMGQSNDIRNFYKYSENIFKKKTALPAKKFEFSKKKNFNPDQTSQGIKINLMLNINFLLRGILVRNFFDFNTILTWPE
jgi:hypothetical protein